MQRLINSQRQTHVHPTQWCAAYLAHQASLTTDVRLTHVALKLGLRHQRSNRVDDDDVHCATGSE